MLEFINIMRILGTILITNSHYERVWSVGALATGGTLGNVLFFFVAGYCLSQKKWGVKYFASKFIKLYTPIFLVQFVCMVIGIYSFSNIKEMLSICVFPTNYWFFPCILCGFIIWSLVRHFRIPIEKTSIFFLMSSIVFRYCMFTFFSTYTFYLAVMGTGIYARNNNSSNKKIQLWHVICSVIVFYGVKIIAAKIWFIGAFENITALVFGLLVYLWISKKEEGLRAIKNTRFHRIVGYIAAMSWHIYLVQVPILKKMPLPENTIVKFLLVSVVIAICAVVLKYVESKLSQLIFERKEYGKIS